MKKYLLIIMLLFFVTPVFAQNVSTNNETQIGSIDTCEGPVRINFISEDDIDDSDIDIKDCSYNSSGIWRCVCDGSFPLIINANTPMSFDMRLTYYLEHSRDEFMNDVNVRRMYIRDVEVSRSFLDFSSFNLNYLYLLLIIPGVLIVLFMFFKKDEDANDDIFNYKKDEDEDIKDILDKIK